MPKTETMYQLHIAKNRNNVSATYCQKQKQCISYINKTYLEQKGKTRRHALYMVLLSVNLAVTESASTCVFHLFLYFLKILENLGFSDVFRGYRKR